MSFLFRAVVLGEETGVFGVLRDFLFRLGLRGSHCTQNIEDIRGVIESDVFPVVFIDHAPGVNEGFQIYESLRKTEGFELLPFFFFVADQNSVLRKFGDSLGAKGTISKPFNPSELSILLGPIFSNQSVAIHQRALATSKAILSHDYEQALRGLTALESTPYYSRAAGIALSRIMVSLSRYSLAEKKLSELLKNNPADLRCLCEVADLFILSNKYPDAIKIFAKLENLDPRITVKLWDHFHLLISIDDINGASKVLERMLKAPNQKQATISALLRMMEFMGLPEIAPLLARHFPQLAKKYPLPTNKEAI